MAPRPVSATRRRWQLNVTIVNVQGEQSADEHRRGPPGAAQVVVDAVAGARIGGAFATPRWAGRCAQGLSRCGVRRCHRCVTPAAAPEDVGIVFE